MRVEMIENPTEKDWLEVKRRCLVTIDKKPVPESEVTYEWKKKILRCRHSPIRRLRFSFYLSDVPYWLHVELIRHHEGFQPYVKSSRDDRCKNDVPRGELPQKAPVNMIVDLNADSLCTIMNKRLCGCATKEMQELMMMIRKEVLKTNSEFEEFMVPMCMYLHTCYEFYPCKGNNLFMNNMN